MPGVVMPGMDRPGPAIGSAKPVSPTVNLSPPPDRAPPSIAAQGHATDLYGAILLDTLEYRGGSGSNIGAWEGQAYYGSDYDKAWINTRGEYNDQARALERAELQLLYSRLVTYFFDAQIGVRQDFPIRPNQDTPARTHLVLGLQGLLPGLFEINAQFFVDNVGTVATSLEGAYDAYITQRIVLEPRAEINLAANSDSRSRVGAGFTRLETGLRLRYEITREFAPYVGVQYECVFGHTARIFKQTEESVDILSAVASIRLFL